MLGTSFFLSNIGLSGSLHKNKSCCKKMKSMSRLEMKKIDGTKFELWNLNMEDILVDRGTWVS
jgi:hypothetical protein